jgi:hypothetical protein
MQADAALHSFFLHCRDATDTNIHVLYLATDPRYVRQYETLIAAYPGVIFVRQTDFQKDMEFILDPFQKGSYPGNIYAVICKTGRIRFRSGSLFEKLRVRTVGRMLRFAVQKLTQSLPTFPYILLLVDDSVFVRDFSLADAARALENSPDAIGFSLRLGKNTSYCYVRNCPQALPAFLVLQGGLLKFDWTVSEYDFGYPLEVSSSVYRAAQLLPLLASFPYSDPNTCERGLSSRCAWFAKAFPNALCFDSSVAFCNPVNKVQKVAIYNRAAETYQYSPEQLAERFDAGGRIDVDAFTGFISNSCHQEVELQFIEKSQNLSS